MSDKGIRSVHLSFLLRHHISHHFLRVLAILCLGLGAVLGALCQVDISHLLIFLLIFVIATGRLGFGSPPSTPLATKADFRLFVRELDIGVGDMVPILHLGLHGTDRKRTLNGLLLLPRYQPTHRGRPFSHLHDRCDWRWVLCHLLHVSLDGL